METRRTLTVLELKALLLAHFSAQNLEQAEMTAAIRRELGEKPSKETPASIAFKRKINGCAADAIARRLKHNQRAVPLVSLSDFETLMPELLNSAGLEKDDAAVRKIMEDFVRASLHYVFEWSQDIMATAKSDPYEQYWRLVNIVLDLAAERGVSPVELFAFEGIIDEITRRHHSKEEFVACNERILEKTVNEDMVKKMVIQPMLNALNANEEIDKEELREMEQELETEIMPELREYLEKTVAIARALIQEKATRIYGA